MHKQFELLPPLMPNFIRTKMPSGKREDGFKELPGIPVHSLTEQEAIEYGQLMMDTFIAHWRSKQANP